MYPHYSRFQKIQDIDSPRCTVMARGCKDSQIDLPRCIEISKSSNTIQDSKDSPKTIQFQHRLLIDFWRQNEHQIHQKCIKIKLQNASWSDCWYMFTQILKAWTLKSMHFAKDILQFSWKRLFRFWSRFWLKKPPTIASKSIKIQSKRHPKIDAKKQSSF